VYKNKNSHNQKKYQDGNIEIKTQKFACFGKIGFDEDKNRRGRKKGIEQIEENAFKKEAENKYQKVKIHEKCLDFS
jgi:hypothetical protein